MENKKILVVVDMQNDFCSEGGSLSNPETISVVSNVVNKIKEYKERGDIIYATQDTHYNDYLNTQEGQKLPVPHCIKNTWGWRLNDRVKEVLGNSEIIEKFGFGSMSLAYEIEVDNILSTDSKMEVEYIGVCTDICVISNVLIHKTVSKETIVKVDSSCCAGTTPEKHNAALKVMKSCQVEVYSRQHSLNKT